MVNPENEAIVENTITSGMNFNNSSAPHVVEESQEVQAPIEKPYSDAFEPMPVAGQEDLDITSNTLNTTQRAAIAEEYVENTFGNMTATAAKKTLNLNFLIC